MNKRLKGIREQHDRLAQEWGGKPFHDDDGDARAAHKDRGELLTMIDERDKRIEELETDRPQYSVCNKHAYLTSTSKMVTWCPECKREAAEAQLEKVREQLKGCSSVQCLFVPKQIGTSQVCQCFNQLQSILEKDDE